MLIIYLHHQSAFQQIMFVVEVAPKDVTKTHNQSISEMYIKFINAFDDFPFKC